jgi:hypothetical protein
MGRKLSKAVSFSALVIGLSSFLQSRFMKPVETKTRVEVYFFLKPGE